MESIEDILRRIIRDELQALKVATPAPTVASEPSPELMTTADLAEFLGVHRVTVGRWRTQVPAYGPPWIMIVSHARYRRADVDSWLTSQRGK